MIDFTNCKELLNFYKGSEKKKTLLYQHCKYLVKFPDPIREKNKNLSYINNVFSEYIGSHIFELIGMDVQTTLLGTYTYNGKEKIVCACKDFTAPSVMLLEFENLLLSINPDKKVDTELSDIMEVVADIPMIDEKKVKSFFWDMFVIDALIGNSDRHNGNWGFLINSNDFSMKIAPVFDCGSCLNPMLEDSAIENLDELEIKNLAINSYSCFKENGKKIHYKDYIMSEKNELCNQAILRIFPRITLSKIYFVIDEISCISIFRKNFYKKIITIRYEYLKKTYQSLSN